MRNIGSNTSSVSIRYASSSKGVSDANKIDQSNKVPVIDIEALRSISRIVLAIKERIAAAGETRPEHNDQRVCGRVGSGSEADREDRSENSDGKKGAGK